MTKRTITRTWIAGLILVAAGAIVCVAGGLAILAYSGIFTATPNGYEFAPRLDGFFWTLVGVCVLGCVAAVAGLITQLVAWVGALVNTYRLEDRTWFAVVLFSGLLAFTCILAPIAFAGMVAYVIAGPNGTAIAQAQVPPLAPRPAPVPSTN
jgi:hypothetical protein